MTSPKEIDASTLEQWLKKGSVTLIDVREEAEYTEECIHGSILIPLSSFDLHAIPRDKSKIVFHCRSGHRSLHAAKKYLIVYPQDEVYNLKGGILAWKDR